MHTPEEDEEDTAFGRLGPRAGPGATSKPSKSPKRPRRWGWLVAAIVVVLLAGLYASGRL